MMEVQPNKQPDTSSASDRRWARSLTHPVFWSALSLVILAAVLMLAFEFRRAHDRRETPVPTAQVSITSKGFFPQTIQIKRGTQITWINQDAKPHEVAADPYPKDDSIPGFNNTLVLQTGDTYSFGFAKSGTYHYHDQLNPLKLLGEVVVK